MTNKLKLLDLFSGIGGFSLGLERTGGFQTVAFCEIEKFPQKVLRKHWPNVPIYEDVRTLNADKLRADGISVDCIAGGFPCQDISTAGKGAGLAGERSGLWFEFHRLIKELRPQWVIAENVSALRSRGLEEVLRSLFEIGYDAEWHCIPASALGAPHQRDRIWIVAYPNKGQRNGQNETLRTGWNASDTSGQDVAYPNSIRQSCEGILWSFINAQRREGEVHRTSDGGSDAAQVAYTSSPELQGYKPRELCEQQGGSSKVWREDLRQEDGQASANITRSGDETLANSNSERQLQSEGSQSIKRRWIGNGSSDVPNSMCTRLQGQLQRSEQAEWPIREERQSIIGFDGGIRRTNDEGSAQSRMGDLADGFSRGMDGSRLGEIWAEEPDIPRVEQGVKNRVQRLKALGNSVVPQIPELIGYAILNSMERHHDG